MSEKKGGPLAGCRDSLTSVLVALIGVAGVVLGVVLERTEVLDEIFPPPPSRVLVADFSEPASAFTSNTITLRECDTAVVEGGVVRVNRTISEFDECRMAVRPKEDRRYDDLGSLEATFQVDDTDEPAESSAYLEMVTYSPGVELKVHCGMMQTQNKLFGFLSVKTVRVGDQDLVCNPPGVLMNDDGICELWFDSFVDLERGQDYTFELRANPSVPDEFQCFASGADSQYWVNASGEQLAENLTDSIFERYILVGHTTGSTATYTVDNVYEER